MAIYTAHRARRALMIDLITQMNATNWVTFISKTYDCAPSW